MADSGDTGVYKRYSHPDGTGWEQVVLTGSMAVLFVSVVSTLVLELPMLVYGLAVPIGIFFGIPGAVGFAIGRLFFALWTSNVAPVVLVQFGGDLLLVAIAYYVWDGRALPEGGDNWSVAFSGAIRYVLTGAIALGCNVVVVSIGSMLLGRIPVVASVPVLFADRGGIVILGGVFGLLGLRFLAGRTPATPEGTPTLSNRRLLGVTVLLFVWVAGAGALGLLRQDITSVPGSREGIASYLPAVVIPLFEFALGPAYHPIQVLGVTLLIVIVILGLVVGRPSETITLDS